MIFDMYGKQGIGYNTIAYKLNQMHIPSVNGSWGQSSIVHILNNEAYLGKIRWRHEPTKKVVQDGLLVKKRVLNSNYELYDGLHEPIISQEQWDAVKTMQRSRQHFSVNASKPLMNPFATIMYCEKCGSIMKRNVPSKKQNTAPWYRCSNRECGCKTMKCDFVEQSVLEAMRNWLHDYTIKIDSGSIQPDNNYETALALIQEQLATLREQQDKVCTLLEKGVYTVEMFSKRNDAISKEIKKLQLDEADLLSKVSQQKSGEDTRNSIIPTTQHILDSYDVLTMEEKNQLWKAVLAKITVFRTKSNDFSIHVYPKVPKQ